MMRRSWIESSGEISLVRQCELAMVTRSTVYAACEPVKVDEDELLLCRLIDEEYTKRPFYGTRRMVVFLRRAGYVVNRKRVGLGGGLDVGIDLTGLLHGLTAHGDAGVVDLGGKRGDNDSDVGEGGEEIYVSLEFGGAETGGKDGGVVLGGIEGILEEGDAVGSGLEEGFAFLGGEVDQEGEFLNDGVDSILDGLDILGGEGCINVLVGHGCFPMVFVRDIIWSCERGKGMLYRFEAKLR